MTNIPHIFSKASHIQAHYVVLRLTRNLCVVVQEVLLPLLGGHIIVNGEE